VRTRPPFLVHVVNFERRDAGRAIDPGDRSGARARVERDEQRGVGRAAFNGNAPKRCAVPMLTEALRLISPSSFFAMIVLRR
jgi:hypothetical protein